ncbi:MAG: hypothetical protein RMN52_00465 [Anaerolineae bacterium]|nr:hypothetical protein [Candidatus Roseilinea sp.]MDW8448449.1 hypothetical protein [Anaerolineae bacterium]
MIRVRVLTIPLAALTLIACQAVPITQSPRRDATAQPITGPTVTPVPSGEPIAVQNMRMLLRQWLGEAGGDARLIEVQQREWPDACFGVGYANESCALVVTPGYEMTFEVEGKRYTFRTDPEAYRYRLTEAPPPEIGETIISWTGGDGIYVEGCAMAEIGTQALAFGDCFGQMMTGRFVNQANRALLDQHVARFATFRANTPSGQIVFTGKGDQQPTPADQRAIAELAQLMYFEARSGRAGASWATAIALRQETTPDRTPICVSVEMTGRVYVSKCEANAPLTPLFLNPSGLDQLYRWVDELALYEQRVTDKEVVTQITFGGRGEREATEDDKRAIRTFTEGLIGEAREQQPELSAGAVRIALPLALPEGLNWDPAFAEANDRSFRARATDPNSEFRWVEVQGSVTDTLRPNTPGVVVELRDQKGTAHNLLEGYAVGWAESGTYYLVSSSFDLTQTLEIASTLVPMPLEQFEQLMRERAAAAGEGDVAGIRAKLEQALTARDFDALKALMGESFVIGYWRSEGVTLTPDEAVAELRRTQLGMTTSLVFSDVPNLPEVQLPRDIGPGLALADAIFVRGWHSDGNGEAILLLARTEDGRVHWHGLMSAMNGFK